MWRIFLEGEGMVSVFVTTSKAIKLVLEFKYLLLLKLRVGGGLGEMPTNPVAIEKKTFLSALFVATFVNSR